MNRKAISHIFFYCLLLHVGMSSSIEHSSKSCLKRSYWSKRIKNSSWKKASFWGAASLTTALICVGIGKYYTARISTHSKIMDAIKENNLPALQTMIQNYPLYLRDAWQTQYDQNGNTPLTLAISLGRQRISRFLLNQGANVNEPNASGVPPLLIAASKSDISRKHHALALLLLENGANPNQKANRTTALNIALSKANDELGVALITHGANVSEVGPESYIPIIKAARNNCYKSVSQLLEHGADPNRKYKIRTALKAAIYKNNIIIVEQLLSHGANPNGTHRWSIPLKIAMRKNHHEIMRLLIKHGASVQHYPKQKISLAESAAKLEKFGCMQILLPTE